MRGPLAVLLLIAVAAIVAGCGGTSSWTWDWASDDGHSTIHATFDGTAKAQAVPGCDAFGCNAYGCSAFPYASGDPRFGNTW